MVGMIMCMIRYLRISSSYVVDGVVVTLVLPPAGAKTTVLTALLSPESASMAYVLSGIDSGA
jgi:hypothetical protein